ncbi:IS21 family transposase [Bacteroidota bacterium]
MNDFYNKLIMYHQIHKMSRDGWSKNRISEFLGINWRTVSKYLQMNEDEFLDFIEEQGNRQRLLSPFEGFVKIKLEKYPDTSAAQMHDWLKEHYPGFPEVTPKTVYNFVMWVRQRHNIPIQDSPREYCIVEELPWGKQAQVDFGEYNSRDGQGKRIKVYFFTMVLSRSRCKYVFLSLTPFTSSLTVYAHIKAFEYYGGIPEEIVYDQDKVLLVNENLGTLILTEVFQSFVQSMPFSPVFCRKSDPESKGKVENVVKYVKYNFLYNRPFSDIVTLNQECMEWLQRTANGMPHAFTMKKPKEQLLIEREHLLEVPPYAFDEPEPAFPVRKHNVVLYNRNWYTVPNGTYQGRDTKVTIINQGNDLIIKDLNGKHLATHEICFGKGRLISNTDHKRDKSKKIDGMMLDVAVLFPDNDSALMYLEKIRKEKDRYARDQFQHIRKCVEKADIDIAGKTLQYCIDRGIYDAKDFEAIMNMYLSQRKADGKAKPEFKKVSLTINKKIAEITPNTSNILDYEKIMKN